MTSSEPFVAIEDCTVKAQYVRSLLVECPHFPDGELHVHLALLSRLHGVPFVDETGTIVVLKRFVDHNNIVEYSTDLPDTMIVEEES